MKLLMKIFFIVICFSIGIKGQDITGSGTSGDPYILYNAADVDSIRYYSFNNIYFKLNNNIDLSSYPNWTPIGSRTVQWRGYFDLNNKVISNLTITSATHGGIGLFGGVGGNTQNFTTPTIFNGSFTNVSISFDTTIVGGESFLIGVVAGYLGFEQNEDMVISNITVSNVTVNTRVSGGAPGDFGYGTFGALNDGCSMQDLRVQNLNVLLYSQTAISSTDGRSAGGINGELDGSGSTKIYRCYVDKNSRIEIDTTGAQIFLGGLFGSLRGCTTITDEIVDSWSRATVIGNYYTGGLAGFKGSTATGGASTFRNCWVAADTVYSNHVGIIDGVTFGLASSGVNNRVDSVYADTSVCNLKRLRGTNSTGVAGRMVPTSFIQDTTNLVPHYDFTDVWGWSLSQNDGYPFLLGDNYLFLLWPTSPSFYFAPDTVQVSWDAATDIPIDTFSVELGDSIWYTTGTSFTINIPSNFGLTGIYYIKLTGDNGVTVFQDSVDIFLYASDFINILSVTTDTAIVQSFNISQIELHLSIGDSTSMDSVFFSTDIIPSGQLDTTIIPLSWPSGTFGDIYIRAVKPAIPVFGLEVERLSSGFSFVYQPQLQCYGWNITGSGGVWGRDVTCGWVASNRSFQTGSSTVSFSDNYTASVSFNVQNLTYPPDTPPPYPPCEHPSVNSCDIDGTSANKTVFYNARTYTLLPSGQLHMYDTINDVGYVVYDFGANPLNGISIPVAGLAVINQWVAVFNNPQGYPIGYGFKPFPAPGGEVASNWKLINVLSTRNYFRGMKPKAVRNARAPYNIVD